jgi:hypothetical protein
MQRGYLWETRQWWISSGKGLLWIVQLIPHAFPQCDGIKFLLGNPVVTRLAGQPVPVCEVESAEGIKADTQEGPLTVSSGKYLRFGEAFVGATLPLDFVRPSVDAFHTFPAGQPWRDFSDSNHITLRVSEESRRWECRESLFFAIQIGGTIPVLEVSAKPGIWKVASESEIFEAGQTQGIWHYTIQGGSGKEEVPSIGFGSRD